MAWVVQAGNGRRPSSRLATAALISALLVLCGCGGGFKLSDADKDASLLTGAVAAYPVPADPTQASDETTIRNAVSSANLDELAGTPLSWANANTDSRGSIFEIGEIRDKDAVCRKFRGSRESFSGVRLFKGEACMSADGRWWMRTFEEA